MSLMRRVSLRSNHHEKSQKEIELSWKPHPVNSLLIRKKPGPAHTKDASANVVIEAQGQARGAAKARTQISRPPC